MYVPCSRPIWDDTDALAGLSAEVGAALVPEPKNRYDPNAISVRINGRVVGYLSRDDALRYDPVVRRAAITGHVIAANAALVGGWDRGPRDRGIIGVVLHLGTPGECLLDLLGESAPAPRKDHEYAGYMVAFTGDSRCIVGGIALDRETSVALAERAGLTVHPRVTKKVQLLVDCDPSGASGNEEKAVQYGIPVVPEVTFWAALGLEVQGTR